VRRTLLLLPLVLTAPALAQEGEITVTATKIEVPVENVGDDVDVITQEEIKEWGLTSISDVLNYIAGVNLSSTGGWGKQSNVFINGLSGRYILVLLNGVPINDPSSPNNKANFEWIDLNNVERIEVLKGSQSSLYGSEAIGGVINIITKKPKKNEFFVNFEGGKYKTFKENLYSGLKLRNGFLSVSAENFKTNGYSATNEKSGKYTYNPDNDGFHYTTGMVSFGYEPSSTVEISGDFSVKGGYTDYDAGDYSARTNYDRFLSDIRAKVLSSENLSWEVLLGNNKEVRDDTFGFYKGITRYVSVSPTYYLGENTFIKSGVSYRYEKAKVIGWPNVSNKSHFLRSVYAEGFTNLFGINLVTALRVDDHKEFGTHKTYKISSAYTFSKTETTFKAQYGTGFKAPTLSQMYGYYESSWGKTVGNPDLDPEKSEGWTLGISQKIPLISANISVNYFKNRIWNLITKTYDSKKNATTYVNKGKAITEGAELKLSSKVTNWFSLFGSYTHLRAVSKENGRWERLERRPKEKFTLGTNLKFQKWKLTLVANHYGSRKDTDWVTYKKVTLNSFTVYNCYLSYKLNDKVEFYARGINLTDKDYELAYGYNTIGRALFVGTRFTF
jgi:vitamin B12 transporter